MHRTTTAKQRAEFDQSASNTHRMRDGHTVFQTITSSVSLPSTGSLALFVVRP